VPVPLRGDECLADAGAEGAPYGLEPGVRLLIDPVGAVVPAAGGAMDRLAAGEFHAWPAGVALRRSSRCKLRSSRIRKRSALGTVGDGP
jgi:hypothetical protein